MFEGVTECYISRFWDMAPGAVVGTLILRVTLEVEGIVSDDFFHSFESIV